jgi:putative ABC transport system permease protein
MQGSTAVMLGAIIYKASISIALKLGLPATDMKMISAILFVIIIVLRDPSWRNKVLSIFTRKEAQ